MAEFPTSSPVSQKSDDLALLDDAALQAEPARDGFASLKVLLPGIRDGDLNDALAALGTA